MKIGTTFAHPHLKYLGLNIKDSLRELKSLNLDIVRLGVYWNEVEPENNKFDFSQTKKLLDFFERNDQDIVLTVGMKSPRWPEFYLPLWLKHKKPNEVEFEVLRFIKSSINKFKDYRCIKYWQVENEPLDPSGPEKLTIPYQLLEKEVKLIKSMDSRPVVVNLWGNSLSQRKHFINAAEIADIVGIDLYYKTPWILKRHHGPKDSDDSIKNVMSSLSTKFWFSELQAEPWEKGEIVAYSDNPPSLNAVLLKDNFEKAKQMNPDVILLWGFEYWLLKKTKGDHRLWDAVNKLVKGHDELTAIPMRRTI